LFEVVFDGFVNLIEMAHRHQYEIVNHEEIEGKHKIIFRMLDQSVTTNTLLQALIQVGNIASFNELLPSMDEIFIKVVNQTKE